MTVAGAVFGLDAAELPEKWTALEAITVLKCLDEDGDTALLMRTTDGLKVWDCVGLLMAALDMQRIALKRAFLYDDDSNDDD